MDNRSSSRRVNGACCDTKSIRLDVHLYLDQASNAHLLGGVTGDAGSSAEGGTAIENKVRGIGHASGTAESKSLQ